MSDFCAFMLGFSMPVILLMGWIIYQLNRDL